MDGRDDFARDDHPSPPDAGHGSGFYSLNANQSSASIFEDVEMAHDQVSCSCALYLSSHPPAPPHCR